MSIFFWLQVSPVPETAIRSKGHRRFSTSTASRSVFLDSHRHSSTCAMSKVERSEATIFGQRTWKLENTIGIVSMKSASPSFNRPQWGPYFFGGVRYLKGGRLTSHDCLSALWTTRCMQPLQRQKKALDEAKHNTFVLYHVGIPISIWFSNYTFFYDYSNLAKIKYFTNLGFPEIRGWSLTKPLGVRSCEVAIIWPESSSFVRTQLFALSQMWSTCPTCHGRRSSALNMISFWKLFICKSLGSSVLKNYALES